MIYNEAYEIEIKLNDLVLDYTPSNFTFSLRDSIYKLYPTGTFKIDDIKGIFNELLGVIEGTKVDISFGTVHQNNVCSYNIIKNSIPDQASVGSFGGMSETSLIHNYLYNQTKVSKSHTDELSSIIKKITSSFKTKHIEVTNNKGTWYQPMVNDAEFMVNYLLPFAYSSSSNKTPYYLFINSNNEFYFQSLATLFSQGITEELMLQPKGSKQSLGKNIIQSIYTHQTPLSEIRSSLHQVLYSFDKGSAQVLKEEIIKDFIQGTINIPIIANLDNVTDVLPLYSEDVEDKDRQNNNLGLSLFYKRPLFLFDKVIIVLNLNTTLIAGRKIKVKVPIYSDLETVDISPRFSGEYIIESSVHTWDSQKGNTIIVASRQGVSLPDTYRIKEQLIKA